MKLQHYILSILIILLIFSGCRKGVEECTFDFETTGMENHIGQRGTLDGYAFVKAIDELDSCAYNLFGIRLYFDNSMISDETCSSPIDSMVGNIDYINVEATYYTDSDTITETMNDKFNVQIEYLNGDKIFKSLNEVNNTHPRCHFNIYLFMVAPSDTSWLQSFSILYKEVDGTTFTTETKKVYITF